MNAKALAAVGLLAIAPLTGAQEGASISGSVTSASGYVAFRDGMPDAGTFDWFSRVQAYLRLSIASTPGEYYASWYYFLDARTGDWTLALDESWGLWEPFPFLGIRLGRYSAKFGPCLAFSPADSLSSKDPLDPRAGKTGRDGVGIAFVPTQAFSGGDAPFTVGVEASLALPRGSFDLEEAGAQAVLRLFVPDTPFFDAIELGLAGDARRLWSEAIAGTRPMSLGAWLSVGLLGFAVGAEAGARTGSYDLRAEPGSIAAEGGPAQYSCAFSVSLRSGDFFHAVEACYDSPSDAWKGFARISWGDGYSSVAISALADFRRGSAASLLDASLAIGDSGYVRLTARWNYLPEEWLPASPYDFTAGLSFEFYF
jgi:hypothetical protein